MPSNLCAFPFILEASFFPAFEESISSGSRAWELLEPQIGLVPGRSALLQEGGISKNSFQCPDGSSVVFTTNEKSEKRGEASLSSQDRSSFMGYMNGILRAKETPIFQI